MMRTLATALLCLLTLPQAFAAEPVVAGAGSSAAAPIYRSWARAYKKETGVGFAYDAVGSSAGLARIAARQTGFGASDVAPLKEVLDKDGLVVFPVAVTGVAVVYNLPSVGDGQLRLSGEILARIFQGEIREWEDAEIARLNPGLKLPDIPIKVVVRGDGSGTSYNFADYLAKMDQHWKETRGVHASFDWPPAYQSVKGSGSVVRAVKNTVGAIGYVDFDYVDGGVKVAQLRNRQGEFVKPSIAAFRAALNNSDWLGKGSFAETLTDQAGAESWPITMGTFALLPRVADKPDEAVVAIKFFIWAFMNGDALVRDNNFVRLPDSVQAAAFRVIAEVTDPSGTSLALGLLGRGGAGR